MNPMADAMRDLQQAQQFRPADEADFLQWLDCADYLNSLPDSRGICVLLVHHTRKSKNPEDSFDNINATCSG